VPRRRQRPGQAAVRGRAASSGLFGRGRRVGAGPSMRAPGTRRGWARRWRVGWVGLEAGGGAGRAVGACAPNEKRGRCCHRPRHRVPAGVLRPRSVPNRAPVRASSNWFPDFGSNRSELRKVPLRFLRPKAPVPPDSGKSGFGFGFPRLLALLSRLPHHRLFGFDPEGPPPRPQWRHSEAFVRFRAAAPDREMPIWTGVPIRGSTNCLWITRITGIESRRISRRRNGSTLAGSGAPAAFRPAGAAPRHRDRRAPGRR
jgi:hypothetical protein